MKIKFLLLGTSLSLVPQTLNAQCVSPIQDCYALGYTQTSCPNGKGVKCPFGNGWYCGGTAAQDCIKLGYDKDCTGAGESGSGQTCNGKYQSCTCDSSYKYTCSGTGYSGGSGSACGGKYTSCTCASGYEWKDGSCQITNPCANQNNTAYNNIYCCNGSVVGIKTSEMNFYIAIHDLAQTNWDNANTSCQQYNFCNNLKTTLPSKEQLLTIYNNKTLLNNILLSNQGVELTENCYWSSSYLSDNMYHIVCMQDGFVGASRWLSYYVRPVLTSW